MRTLVGRELSTYFAHEELSYTRGSHEACRPTVNRAFLQCRPYRRANSRTQLARERNPTRHFPSGTRTGVFALPKARFWPRHEALQGSRISTHSQTGSLFMDVPDSLIHSLQEDSGSHLTRPRSHSFPNLGSGTECPRPALVGQSVLINPAQAPAISNRNYRLQVLRVATPVHQ